MSFIGCMLSQEYTPKKVSFPCAIEAKVDGFRTVHVAGEGYTRNGNRYDTIRPFSRILHQVVGDDSIHVDGELFGADWNSTSTLVKRTRGIDYAAIKERVTAYVFDVYAPHTLGKETYEERRTAVEWIVKRANELTDGHKFDVTPQWIVSSEGELQDVFSECLTRGFEGIMIKPLNGLYVPKRAWHWMKLKPEKDITVTIVGGEHGWAQCPVCMPKEIREERTGDTSRTAKVRLAHPNCATCGGQGSIPDTTMLGSFHCVTDDGEDVKVGMGMTHAQKREYWQKLPELVGKKIDVKVQDDKANDITARHPVFKGFRWDL